MIRTLNDRLDALTHKLIHDKGAVLLGTPGIADGAITFAKLASNALSIYQSAATGWTPSTGFSDTGATITLPAGKWLVQGRLSLDTSMAAAERFTGQIWDNTSSVDLYQNFVYGSNNLGANIVLDVPITLVASCQVKLRMKVSTVQGAQFLASGRLWALPATSFP
jgi:hypothetical protein